MSYDIPGQLQRFARARAFRDAEDRAAQEIAENIQTRLASFFVAGPDAHLPEGSATRAPRSPKDAQRDSGSMRRPSPEEQGSVMVALRGKEIDAFLARPDPARPIILLYGPDAGLVRERADALLASAVDDPNDPFSLVQARWRRTFRRAVAAGR